MSVSQTIERDPAAAETASVRVAIVDDHESVRLGLRAAFADEGYTVVTVASTVDDLITELAGREVDVVVLDLSLGDGSTVTDNVKRVQAAGAAVLVHSIADRVGLVREALAAGAAGVIPKSSATKTVIVAAATVARGEVLNNLEWATAIDADRDFAKAQLGRREREILHLYASGLPLKLAPSSSGSGTRRHGSISTGSASSTSRSGAPRPPRSICSVARWRTASCRASTPTVAKPSPIPAGPSFGHPVRNPLSLVRVDSAGGRIAAAVSVAFFLQSIPLQITQLPRMAPLWSVTILTLLIGSLLAIVVAVIVQRFVRPAYISFPIVYLIALVSWPFAVADLEAAIADNSSYWLYFLLTIATAMAVFALELPIAIVYTIATPVLYGVIRVTPAGGATEPLLAVLDSVYSILLGGSILILIAVLRYAATGVDIAQQNALERYSHAVRQHAMEAERVQVDSIVHDSVLTTLLSAARAYSPEAKALAATMAGNAIGHLRDAVATAPDSEATISGEIVAQRIVSAAESMSQPFAVRTHAEEWCQIPIHVAEAAYSATVQAMVNSLQHAGPGVERWVDVRSHGHQAFTIEVGDKGAGFDLESIPNERLGVRVSILERVASAGGQAAIDTGPGRGTVLTLTWDGTTAPDPLHEGVPDEVEEPA